MKSTRILFVFLFFYFFCLSIPSTSLLSAELITETITENNILTETQYLNSEKTLYFISKFKLPEFKLISKDKIQLIGDKKLTLLSYKFENEKLISIDEYNNHSRVIKREVADDNGNITEEINYSYKSPSDYYPHAFIRKSKSTGVIIAQYDNSNLTFDLNEIYSNDNDKEHKIEIAKDANRTLVAIIDSGIDHNHPNVAYKFMINYADPIDDIDNDFDGLIDNFIGWSIPLKKGLPVERINPASEIIPLSHGTHVADIMLRDVDQAMLLPFTGDYGESSFLDLVSKTFQELHPAFANLSFLFPHYSLQEVPKETYFSLQNLIKNNPDTLFFTAAGNDFQKELKDGKQGLYPACFDFENIITIGALDSNTINESDMPRYQLAPYSNYSVEHVDILAPGSDIEAASLGGGTIKHTGTSMATPYALNIALKIKIQYPNLTGQEIKKILMYTAYIPDIDNPIKVRSGGIIFERRAHEIAQRYYSSQVKNDFTFIRTLSKEIRTESSFNLSGEFHTPEYFQKLETIWDRF